MQPDSFDAELAEQWSRWVLDHGLPTLPGQLEDAESVPVACWVGPESAAVLHLQRWPPADLREPDDELVTQVDVQVFERVEGSWTLAASGGSGGWPEATLTRVAVATDHASLSGVVGGGSAERSHLALWGEVGTAAATLEVEQDGVTTSRTVVAPVGWVVVSAALGNPFTARVRDSAGRVLTEELGPPADW